MKLQVHSIHFDADTKLIEFIQQKLNKLDQFYDRITNGEVFLRLTKGESNKGHQKLLEIKINVPGASLFVKETAKSFEEAVDLAIEALKVQIKKFKEKIQTKNAPKHPADLSIDLGVEID
jgi:putative sigma-54 modulation protein